jgi:imidazolonepropionase-like amidohydrolase
MTTTSGRVVLRAGALFDGISATLAADPVVTIESGKIVSVAVGGSVRAPGNRRATIVDLPGATLMPGLIDAHLHLCFDASDDPIGHLAALDDDALLAQMAVAARRALRAGVTTVRDLGDRGYLALDLRDQPAGADPLPTILGSGPPITTPGGHCHFLGGEVDGPAEARAAVRERNERGVDVIKVMASGGNITAGSLPHMPQFSSDVLRIIADEAHALGLGVTAHAHAPQSIADAVAAGIDGIEHATFMTADGVAAPEGLIQAIAERQVAVGATVGFDPRHAGGTPAAIQRRMPAMLAARRRLIEAGAFVVAGSDAGLAPVKPHDVLRFAPEQLAALGMTPAAVLRAMTSKAAKACGVERRKGRIAPGFDADILAVVGDPLRDVSAIRNLRAVYARGAPA